MKGQTQAVTATLVTTVIIGSVATAYVWGVPLLEKRQSQTDLQSVEEDAINIYETIESVSNGGSGTAEEVSLSPPGDSSGEYRVLVDPSNNYVEITTSASNPPYPLETWTLVRGRSLQNITFGDGDYGISGQDEPGVVGVRPVGASEGSLITYRTEFRNMETQVSTGDRLNKIDLQVQGQRQATGETTLVFSNQGTEFDTGEDQLKLSTNETMDRERSVVEVEIR